ncbi:TPA: hypothetical protein JLG49_003332 [Escherichia coli]|nr:hypothetical protein [Escherichia coli]HAV9576677.1 hypothetical protein [Escherichia coli]HAW1643419.1 hypothetical protein [Escherichia coli]HAW4054938.1 hypothetical protein [Escherichia coli]HAW4125377.1 hypothetical protein [Escherichia coli]
MWILIFWMLSPYSAGMVGEEQPALQVESQTFNSEKACRNAFTAIKKLNNGELVLRGVCTPKGEYIPPRAD